MRNSLLWIFASVYLLFSCSDDPAYMHGYRDGKILIPFKEEGSSKWGFMDYNGTVVVNPILSDRPSFAVDGLALTIDYDQEETCYSFIRVEEGKATKISKCWDLAGEFHEGLAPVREKVSRIKFINPSMNVVFTAEAMEVGHFNEGLAAFKSLNGKWGFLDKSGKTIISPEFEYFLCGFSGGFAAMANGLGSEREVIIIDKKGKVSAKFKMDVYTAKIREGKIGLVTTEGCGFFTPNGGKIISVNKDWDLVTEFFNGYASFREDRNWGLLDSTGKIVLPSDYSDPIYVSEGFAWVCSNEKYSNSWRIVEVERPELKTGSFKLKGVPYPFMCGKSLVATRYRSHFLDVSGESIVKTNASRIANFDPKYYPGFAWNETFASSAFETQGIVSRFPEEAFVDTTISDIVNLFAITNEELFGDAGDLERDYKNEQVRYFSSNTRVFRVNYGTDSDLYDYDYLSLLEDLDAEEAIETVKPYISDYKSTIAKGVSNIELSIDFYAPYVNKEEFDYYAYYNFERELASTSWMNTDAAREYFVLDDEDKLSQLKLNEEARVESIQYRVRLTEEYFDKSLELAKAYSNLVAKHAGVPLTIHDNGAQYSATGILKNGRQLKIRAENRGEVVIIIASQDTYVYDSYWEDEFAPEFPNSEVIREDF